MQIRFPGLLSLVLTAGAACFSVSSAGAEVTFNFEDSNQLNSPIVGGDLFNFAITAERGRNGSGSSLKFVDPAPQPYESFTYDLPFDTFTSGVISVWFYDTRGAYNTGHGVAKSGGAIILENSTAPQDFVAVEALSYPYGLGPLNTPAYYASEGSIDRLLPNDRFDIANLPARTIGHHKVEFHVSPTETRVFVDGMMSKEVSGPGSTASLRLRFMADSPSNGGSAQGNWITNPKTASVYAGEWLYFDDIEFRRELPSPATATQGFEVVNDVPEFDRAGASANPGTPAVPPFDNVYMMDFENQWAVSTSATAAHSGQGSAHFVNSTPALRSITFDLSQAEPNTTATLYFYDALGQNVDFDHDNSIILENANDPAEFIALQVNNWPYPYGAPVKNYYLTEGTGGQAPFATLYSSGFGARSIGWHKVEIGLYENYSLIALNGAVALRNGSGGFTNLRAEGPGLDTPLRLRLMADDATQGGYSNWTAVNELTASYRVSTKPYVYYDDITLPLPGNAAVNDWVLY